MARRLHRSDRFLAALEDHESVLIATHDTPDPDAIASGWGLHALVRERLGKPVRLIGRGPILRAENVRMLELLQPPLELVDGHTPDDRSAVVLVDCSPAGSNQLFSFGDVTPIAFIDHHNISARQPSVRFRDLRPKSVASAAIVASYLRTQAVQPTGKLATALVYAMHTEITGTPVRFSRSERGILSWLGKWVDHQLLRDIEDAPLSRQYYEDLISAIGSTFLYGSVAFSMIPDVQSPEIVGEIADLLIRCHGVDRVLCGAVVGADLVFSCRTTVSGGNAVRLVGEVLKGAGHWGGHPNRAGGRIPGKAGDREGDGGGAGGPAVPRSAIEEVKGRWLDACGVNGARGVRLVARREILEIL